MTPDLYSVGVYDGGQSSKLILLSVSMIAVKKFWWLSQEDAENGLSIEKREVLKLTKPE